MSVFIIDIYYTLYRFHPKHFTNIRLILFNLIHFSITNPLFFLSRKELERLLNLKL